jgi:hypothetical protein
MVYFERVGRQTLISSGVIMMAAILFCSHSPAQEARFDTAKQLGRYQIVMHPTFRADQYIYWTL